LIALTDEFVIGVVNMYHGLKCCE